MPSLLMCARLANAQWRIGTFFTASIAALLFPHHATALDAERSSGQMRSDIVIRALTLLDTPYRHGGSNPASGFDCSGLVKYVYQQVTGRQLPRRSEDIGRLGETITPSQLEAGDLVFFNTLSRAYSHVAIYIGDGRFLHAPARGGRVRIEALDDRYWRARFDGARRLIDADIVTAATIDKPAPRIARTRARHPDEDAPDVIKP